MTFRTPVGCSTTELQETRGSLATKFKSRILLGLVIELA